MPSRNRNDAAFLNDVAEACGTIIERSRHRNFSDFVSNGEFRDSVILQLIILGESSNYLTDRTKDLYPGAPWREVIGLRNLLIHKYWTVDHLKIWKVVQEDVPQLLELLSS